MTRSTSTTPTSSTTTTTSLVACARERRASGERLQKERQRRADEKSAPPSEMHFVLETREGEEGGAQQNRSRLCLSVWSLSPGVPRRLIFLLPISLPGAASGRTPLVRRSSFVPASTCECSLTQRSSTRPSMQTSARHGSSRRRSRAPAPRDATPSAGSRARRRSRRGPQARAARPLPVVFAPPQP